MDRRYSSWLLERVCIGNVIRLHFGKTTIGRQVSSDIRITDSSYVSRNHAEIEVAENDQDVEIRDLNSINGVYVNDTIHKQNVAVLRAGDRIGIGVDVNDDDVEEEKPVFLVKFMPYRRAQVRPPPAVRPPAQLAAAALPPAVVVNNEVRPPAQLATQQGVAATGQAVNAVAVSSSGSNELAKEAGQSSSSTGQANGLATPKRPPTPSLAQPIRPNETNGVLAHDVIITLSDDEDEEVTKYVKGPTFADTLPKIVSVVGKVGVAEDIKPTIFSDVLPKIMSVNTVANDTAEKVTVEHVRPTSSSNLLPKIVSVEHLKTSSSADLLPRIVSVAGKVTDDPAQTVKPSCSELSPKIVSVVGKVADEILPSFNNRQEKETKSPSPVNGMHMPILPSLKVEHVRSVSADIKSIFGDPDELILSTVQPLNPLVYNNLNGQPLQMGSFSGSRKPLVNGECFSLSSDDEDDEAEKLGEILEYPPTTDSLGSKEQPVVGKQDSVETEDPTKSLEDDNNLNDDEEEEGMMFSQMLIKDMKAELKNSDDDNEGDDEGDKDIPFDQLEQASDNQPSTSSAAFSSEKLTSNRNLDSSVWVISDDEDFDEELESKVSGWSNRLFSQSLSQAVNMSQVYELDDHADSEEDDDDDDDNNCDKHDKDDAEDEVYDAFANDLYNLEFDDADRIIDEMYITLKDKIDQKCEEEKVKGAKDVDETKDNDKNGYLENEKQPKKISQRRKSAVGEHRNKAIEVKEFVKIDDEKARESDVTDFSESPIVKRRSSNVSKRVLSSSEDETEEEEASSVIKTKSNESGKIASTSHKIANKVDALEQSSSSSKIQHKVDERRKSIGNDNCVQPPKPIKRGPPPVIDAPQLPKHKGKLRGVSASAAPVICAKKLAQIRENIRSDRNTNNLKRKWLEKPSVGKSREKEQHKVIKQSRKEKLKELADKEHKHHGDEPQKRKLPEDIERSSKKPKIKLTTANRGAFLTKETETVAPKPFKIPRVNRPDEAANQLTTTSKDLSPEKGKIARNLSVDQIETFSQQLSKPDKLLLKRQHSIDVSCLPSSSSSSTITKPPTPVCKEAVTARSQRTTNKVTFASMQKNFNDTLENQKKLEQIANNNNSCLTNTDKRDADTGRTKKRVRFNDEPIIYYIERVSGASKKADKKELLPRSSHIDRRMAVRGIYPIVDCTSKITSKILEWSNEWLVRRNAKVDAAGDVIYPMPNQFRDFEHYKSIIFPLMKLEFMSMLEHDYNATGSGSAFKVTLEYVTQNKERLTMITKFVYQNKKQQEASKCDLVILDFGRKSTFAFMSTNRTRAAGSFSSNTIVFEIMATNYAKEFFKSIKEIGVRPVVDNVRVDFGAVNAVYQLEATPLFHKILDPLELLKYRKVPQKKKTAFKGYDNLNDTQRQVVINTYGKAIDDKKPTITLIQGPPGTGKSCVITNLTLQSLYGDEVRWLDKKILICAQSNAAVDVIAEKLFRIRHKMRHEQQFRIVRFGIEEKISPKVLPISLQKLVENEQKKRLLAHNDEMQIENKENLAEQMKQLELQIAEMKTRNISGTVEEDTLIDKKRKLQQMKNISNAHMCPQDERRMYEWFLNNANIVCATLSSCVKMSQYVNYFDMCIIDEATQCTEPYTLLPLKFGINSLVLVGDTQQLPATVLSKKAYDYGLGTSLFTRIQNCLETVHKSMTVETPSGTIHMLQTQYRMNAEICKWPNLYFYKNKLINADITKNYKTPIQPFCILNLPYYQNKPLNQLPSGNAKISNNLEAEFVAQLLKALDGFIPTIYNSYGVITPYAHHRNTLENAIKSTGLTHVMVNTIDSYQGLEKDVIIISNARTSGIGFLANPQRLNVALTRPRKCLILCGNFKHLESVPAWKSVLANARERNIFHEISANCLDDIQKNVIDKIKV